MEQGGPLERNVEIANLGESVYGDIVQQVKRQCQEAGNEKLLTRVIAVENGFSLLTKEYEAYKKNFTRSMYLELKRGAINVPAAAGDDEMRTNAWNRGDFKRLREPPKKTSKKNARKNGAGAGKKKRKK